MKYLFTAEDENKELYKQTDEDKSKDGKGSAYTDIKDKKIIKFWLEGDNHIYLVDLEDGHFEVDGIPFKMHTDLPEGTKLKDLELVYYRTNTLGFVRGVKEYHRIEFCFGWKTNIGGKTYKQIMKIQ